MASTFIFSDNSISIWLRSYRCAKTTILGCGHFQAFRPGFSIWHIRHVVRHGHLPLKQLRLSVLNEMHTNSYTGPRLSLKISVAIFSFRIRENVLRLAMFKLRPLSATKGLTVKATCLSPNDCKQRISFRVDLSSNFLGLPIFFLFVVRVFFRWHIRWHNDFETLHCFAILANDFFD